MRLGEDAVHSLELVPVRLDKRKVHDRHEGQVETHEHEVRLPADAVDHDGAELHDGVVEDPVRTRTEPISFRADADRRHLRRVASGSQVSTNAIKCSDDGTWTYSHVTPSQPTAKHVL